MTRRSGKHAHYELVFEQILRDNEVLYIAVDESKEPIVDSKPVKNFDFIVSSFNGKFLVDIKGKIFSSKSKLYMWDNWVNTKDLSGLRIWGNHFNAFVPLLVVPYFLNNPLDATYLKEKADIITYNGMMYAFTAITLADYYTNARPRSKSWNAIYVHRDKFKEITRPLSNFIPEIKKGGRPKRPITEQEKAIVKETYAKYRVSASTLEKLIKRDYALHIPHNHIHRIMIMLELAKPKGKKDVRKKNWIRYERRHSLTAVHIDWHYDPITKKWIFAVIDDASRYLLAYLEVGSATTDASIEGMKQALKHGKIKQCISDHGTQFIKQKGMKSTFKKYLKTEGIKQILCRIKHPQSNGKVEKWFDLYKNHRHAFDDDQTFIKWYNEIRPHRSLRFEELETPHLAFIRKMKAEV